jgi:hypothetical protein
VLSDHFIKNGVSNGFWDFDLAGAEFLLLWFAFFILIFDLD